MEPSQEVRGHRAGRGDRADRRRRGRVPGRRREPPGQGRRGPRPRHRDRGPPRRPVLGRGRGTPDPRGSRLAGGRRAPRRPRDRRAEHAHAPVGQGPHRLDHHRQALPLGCPDARRADPGGSQPRGEPVAAARPDDRRHARHDRGRRGGPVRHDREPAGVEDPVRAGLRDHRGDGGAHARGEEPLRGRRRGEGRAPRRARTSRAGPRSRPATRPCGRCSGPWT